MSWSARSYTAVLHMALRMSRPVALKSGIYHLNVRVPADLATKAKGTRVRLPIGESIVSAKIGDKVIASLGTRDAKIAKDRHARAVAALMSFWQAMRAGPKSLTHRQIVALAGEAYRRRSTAFGFESRFEPKALMRTSREQAEAFLEWKYGDGDGDDLGEIADEHAAFYEAMQRPSGPQLYAFEHRCSIIDRCFAITYEEAIEDLFADEAEALIAEQQVLVDAESRRELVGQIAEVVRLATARLVTTAEGDFSPDKNLARFPPIEIGSSPAPVETPEARGAKITVEILFSRWCSYNADKKASSTTRRYGPSIRSLGTFLKGRDVRNIEQDDLWAWAEHRRDVDDIAARTVNRNDLVAAKSLFNFAATRDSDDKPAGAKKKPLRADNPVAGVKLVPPKEQGRKSKVFKGEEIRAILELARSVEIDPKWPRASASRRWASWICAYSGARVQEVCWLRREDFRREEGVWVMEFPMTKDGFARTVPLHDALVEEGLVDFVRGSREGFLFVGDRPQKSVTKMTMQELRAGDIATWVRDNVALASHVRPNHSWRHTFITIADDVMTKRLANRIAGHNKQKDASDGYYDPPISTMKAALNAYPRYVI